MGTIAQKLEYLNDTRLLLKDNINKINNVLDDNSTFRSYPQELFNGYLDILNNGTDTLWSNLEKVSQTGTEAVLEGVETAPMKMVLNGNTIQDGTPTPDTPVEVKVVKGNNVVSVSGKNLFKLTSASVGSTTNATVSLENGEIKVDWTGGYNLDLLNTLQLDSNKTYIISFKHKGDRLHLRNGSSSTNVLSTTIDNDYTSYALTITNISLFALRFIRGNSTLGTAYIKDIQCEEGSTATPYVPYSKTDYPINLASKNLFSTENLVNATITDTGEYLTGDNRCTGDYVFLDKSQENLALSFNLNILFMGIAFYDENKQYLSRATINNINLLTTPIPANADYCRAFFQFTTSPAAKIDAKIVQLLGTQLEYGTERTNYVLYFTPIELCKINTYKDYFHKDSGNWYVHKEIGKKILNGSENWNTNRENDNYMRFHARALSNVKVQNTGYSNLFIVQNESSSKNTLSVYSGNDFNVYIWLSKSIADSVANFKTWLSTHNTIVYYILATPTEEEITNTTLIEQLEAISKAKSVKDKTYITQTNDDLPFILGVEAIKEYEVN